MTHSTSPYPLPPNAEKRSDQQKLWLFFAMKIEYCFANKPSPGTQQRNAPNKEKKKCVHAPSRRNNKYAECRYADKRIITICGVFATSNKYTHIDAGTCSIIIASMMRDEWRRRSRKSANAKTIYRHRHHFPWDIDRSAGCHLEKLVNGAQPSRRYESKCEEWTVHIARYLYTLWIRLPPHRLCQFFFHEFEFQYPLLQAPWYRRPMRTGNGGLCQ